MFFLQRNRILLEKINEYCTICDTAMIVFKEAVLYYLKHGNSDVFKDFMERIHTIEAQADDVLHSIENVLYAKSLLPESREDLKTLLERYDDIIDSSNHILKYLYSRGVSIPSFLHGDISKMLDLSLDCYFTVHSAIVDLFGKREKIVEFVKTINDYESQCDELETCVIKKVFSSDCCDSFTKLLVAELINLVAKLSDSCEDSGDYITIINIKRVI